MTALSQDAVADLQQRIAELERQLETAVNERDAAIERQTASALVNFRLKNELRAVTDRQKASAEILNAIANTQGDAEHALQRIAEVTQHFFNAAGVSVRIAEGDQWVQNVRVGDGPLLSGAQPASQSTARGHNLPATVYRENRQIHIPDLDNIDPSMANWPAAAARGAGIRTISGTPLRRDGKPIGTLLVYRDRLAGFTEDELALQQSFADQAVIAIENARLFNETERALARQTATSDILRVISGSPTDVQPVFDEIVLTAARLLRCDRAFIQRHDGGSFWTVAAAGQGGPLPITLSNRTPLDPEANFPSRAIVAKETLHLPDWSAIELPEFERGIRELHGINSAIYMPLLRDGECIGLLALIAKQANLFGASEIALAESFRDQALIAIENTRLFSETQEALERQTATSDILKVIASSPSDVQPVFEAIVNSAARLFEPCTARITTLQDGMLHWHAANAGAALQPNVDLERAKSHYPLPFDPDRSPSARAILERRIIEIPDVAAPDTPEFTRRAAAAGSFRSIAFVPLINREKGVGTIIVTHAQPGFRLSEKQLSLAQTFADQAVIAIENTRLFRETQEALERQTATADILKVIASSPSDVQPVFEAIAASANRLIGGFSTAVFRFIDGVAHLTAFTPTTPEADEVLRSHFPRPVDGFEAAELAQQGRPGVVTNTEEATDQRIADIGRARGFSSMLFVPLMNSGVPIGLISVTRAATGLFATHHVQLLQTFADQAVIAIQNTRLFNETKEALERQTATADILKVIASSPSDVQPVFEAIVGSAKRLLGGFTAAVFRLIDENVHLAAYTPTNPAADEALKADFPQPVENFEAFRLAQHGKPFAIPDTEEVSHQPLRDIARLHGFRSMLWVPITNGGKTIGIISVTRAEPGAFAPHHVQLLQTFADQAVIAIENTRLFNETKEALERQTATADILKVIASSPSDVQPVFDAILARALHLCEAAFGFLATYDGERYKLGAQLGVPLALAEHFRDGMDQPRPGDAHWRLLEGEDIINGLDQKDEEAYRSGNPLRRAVVDLGGARSALVVALRKSGALRGSITIYRKEVRPFSTTQTELLRHFADQAVIAIENTRLFNEVQERTRDLSESLQQQTATSEVLQIISSSPGDLTPVFDKMLENATRVCGAEFGSMILLEGDMLRQAALYNAPPAFAAVRTDSLRPNHPRSSITTAIREKRVVQVEDLRNQPAYLERSQAAVELAELGGARTVAVVPMLRDDEVIGLITVFRQEVRPFSDKQIELLSNFARQAVIAIENARLLRELRESTEHLSESLQQQTATSEVLQIISSSPSDLAPVFDKMLENATRVCGAEFGSMLLVEDELVRQAALYNAPAALAAVRAGKVSQYDPLSAPAIAISTRQVVQIEDVRTSAAYLKRAQATVQIAELGGARTIVVVPMLRDDEAIGSITVYRQEVRPFSEKQVELLTNFARQAVIAIENARLLRELRQRTDDLSESLQFQTASADVLKVISRSPDALQPVLDAIVDTSCELCGSLGATIFVLRDGRFHLTAVSGELPGHLQYMQANPVAIGQPGSVLTRVVREKRSLHIPNVMDDPELREGTAGVGGPRALLAAPLMRDGEVVGVIMLRQSHLKPFTPRQIQAIETFADQAVIAISNVNLFEQVQAKTRDLEESLQFQTASADVLKVISRSPDTLQPVLDVIVETSRELCGADASTIFLLREAKFHVAAISGSLPTHLDHLKANPLPVGQPGSILSRLYDRKHTINLENVLDDPELRQGPTGLGGARALLTVPLLSEGRVIGAITLRQPHTRPFTPRQIQAIETFADQAVIAISNVNLFDEVQQRTRELSESLDDLRTAQDRLIQTEKLASLGQLTAGIAHEIKNPLNFVNNFAALSAELTDELKDVLKPAVLDETMRAEVDEVTGLLKDNLSKVVQHGKRADSIVKNMLLHSREGTGEHRPADVNALVDESLNLAYHGARAEKPQFNVTLQRDFDPAAGMVEVFPQEITRVLLNLISNGFYAVTRRKADNGGGDFEPLVTAITLGRDDYVEIRIRDNGTGIPPEVKERMFNPFFTTKPAGEGTGLGLSMSHDIIVKQHGGTIEVETEPGAFTEFRLVLPRTRPGERQPMTGTMPTETDLQRSVDALRRELETRTAELAEARAERVATAEILGVINSSPANLTPVFEAILRNAHALCGVAHGTLQILENGYIRAVAIHGIAESLADILRQPRAVAEAPTFQALLQGQRYSQVNDVRESESPILQRTAQLQGARTLLSVPLRREGKLLGMIVCARREVKPFTEREISLLESFAAQAVIAIENARLLQELRARTSDLSESLQQQTATSEVLKVISRSAFDLVPALVAICETAARLCGADQAAIFKREGDLYRFAAAFGFPQEYEQAWRAAGLGRIDPDSPLPGARSVALRRPVHVLDVTAEPGYRTSASRGSQARTALGVPLLRDGEPIGNFVLGRRRVEAFSDRQIELIQTFADQAVIAIENARLFNEVQAKTRDVEEALRYQTGSANILNVIASSPTDVRPVLKAIVESACELCEAYDAAVVLRDGEDLRFSAHHGPIPIGLEKWPINRRWTAGRAFLDRKPVHIEDLRDEKHADFSDGRELALRMGHRSILSVPLLREGESIGAIILRRTEVHPFSDKQIALLQTFADQAVIAIGNVRLFEEVQAKTHDLEEALRYQTGSANILNVIASSPTDVQPVLKAIVESACELCEAYDAVVTLRDGAEIRVAAHHGPIPMNRQRWLNDRTSLSGRAMADRRPVHVQDVLSDESHDFALARDMSIVDGCRTLLSAPLLREGEAIGGITLRRAEVHPFNDKQIALLQTFADQAVIALGNVHLFEEVQARTRDLQESLQQQTATADVLKVISRSAFDLKPVFSTIVQTASRLCEAEFALIYELHDDRYEIVAANNAAEAFVKHAADNPLPPGRSSLVGRTALERKPVHIPDCLADPEYLSMDYQAVGQYRTMLGVPLLREGLPIGIIGMQRTVVRPFTDKQIELVTTFADQAVIAIENVRLFEEVQARTRDLQESLQQQTATADVLKVISRSAFDLQTVLDTLVESAARLCEADMSVITRQRGDTYYRAGSWGFAPEFMEYVKDLPIKPERATITGRTLLEGKVTHVHDVYTDPDYSFPEAQRLSGDPRTILGVPLLREGRPVGALALLRMSVRPFTDKQIELVTTFADQAVIAIENVRLFDEVQARTRELAKSLDDLRAAQDRLVQTEKLASLGQLTAGIAHEIKNPLNFVNNFAALSIELTDELNDVLKQAAIADRLRAEADELTGLLKDNLAKVVQHGKRADSIVKNMLLHSREGSGEHRPADINALVDESLNLAYHGARAEKPQFNVTLQRNFDPEAGMVDVFPQEITRVFLNLLSNGFYAVTKRKAENGAGFEPVVSAMTKGRTDGVEIRIRDNGTGIPPEVKEKMFNPFFTTKPAGEGTGLGLSMSYDIIVKQHGGTIDVETVPEEFTEFTIVLPRTSLSKKN